VCCPDIYTMIFSRPFSTVRKAFDLGTLQEFLRRILMDCNADPALTLK